MRMKNESLQEVTIDMMIMMTLMTVPLYITPPPTLNLYRGRKKILQNIFCLPFFTKTKREYGFPGHIHGESWVKSEEM